MRDFFKPWRRKLGVVTLVMACVFAAGWVRSEFYGDDSSIALSGRSIWIGSASGSIRLVAHDKWPGQPPILWNCERSGDRIGEVMDLKMDIRKDGGKSQYVALRYWSVVLPLMLLSAWLLLGKPRPAPPKQMTAPAPTTGT